MLDIKRSLEKTITYLMQNFPCVAIVGARQVGKSTLLRQILPHASFFDLEREADFRRVDSDPELLFQEVQKPLIFDEAQLSPRLFKALRVEIDNNRNQNAQFLISGSSSPELLHNISETLAGRIAIVHLDALMWDEAMQVEQSGFVSALSTPEKLKALKANYTKRELLNLCLHGGYPEPFLKRDDKHYFSLWMENYVKTYVERDIRALFPTLKLDVYKRFIQMLAYASGEIINASNFARSLDVSQPTVKHYMDIVEGTFLWRKLPSYQKNVTKRVIKMPKGHIRDTGLINYFLRIDSVDDMRAHPQFGNVWESFVIEQIIRSFESQLERADFYYYRTQNLAEIDLIIESRAGLIPVEIKAGASTDSRKLSSLKRFIEEQHCPFGIVVNNGDEIYKLAENIYQVPAIFL